MERLFLDTGQQAVSALTLREGRLVSALFLALRTFLEFREDGDLTRHGSLAELRRHDWGPGRWRG